MTLQTSHEWYDLPLDGSFSIARNTTDTANTVVVRIKDGTGTVGIGSATPSEYYGETQQSVETVLPPLLAVVEDADDPVALQQIDKRMREVTGGSSQDAAARAAISIACHDFVCTQLDVPLYRYLGLDPTAAVPTCHSIGLASPDTMQAQAANLVADGYSILKVKLGTDRDIDIISSVREAAPNATIRADANGAWTVQEAIEMTEILDTYDVEFVEQPVPPDEPIDLARVRTEGAIPVAADESCVVLEDVPDMAALVDIVVIKLMKCGGIREAIRMIQTARAHDLEIMLGCMTESNASIAAGCHLTPLVDYADLDGSLLLDRDPFTGVPMSAGRIDLTKLDKPGTGVQDSEDM